MTLFPLSLLLFAEGAKAPAGAAEHTVAIFLIEVVLMLFFGRVLGEVMQRFGQPAVMGQLIAGVILGPSLFGHFFPELYQVVFPDLPVQKKMIDAISQLGVLMLLLLTGMETDLKLVNKMRKTAFMTSLSGILIPFICGYVLGEFLPDAMIPNPEKRLVTSLFLATALSISSVKIVAMVIMEVGFLRRNIGQIILASAILDDTIGWIIIAVIGGLAASGSVDFASVGIALGGTILFLVFSLTIGRRFVAYAIRWTNDNLVMELPVITTILVIMITMALLTDWIGVHTVLGAFVVGILVGQSPILTKQVEGQLRGLIVGLFAPVFFAVAGREIDLTVLNSFYQIKIAIAFILIASLGKIGGAFIGGTLSKLGHRASTALAIGMNARGSTEVIVATIGLSLGVLNRDLFTLIVVMAIVTTLITPPLLRWALNRIPPTGEEKERLEREEAIAKRFVPNIERVLVAADGGANGKLASYLAGHFSGGQKLLTTVLDLAAEGKADEKGSPGRVVKRIADEITKAADESDIHSSTAPSPTVLVNEAKEDEMSDSVLKELEKGYDLLFLGVDGAIQTTSNTEVENVETLARILTEYDGVTGICMAKNLSESPITSSRVLLPITGTDYSQKAAEVAIAIVKASGGTMTALHVVPPATEIDVMRRPDEIVQAGRTIVNNIAEIGEGEGVKVKKLVKVRKSPEGAILNQIKREKYDLVVVGVKNRGNETSVQFGHRISVLLEKTPCSTLIVNS